MERLIPDFNSNLVRLKDQAKPRRSLRVPKFQFQSGTIKGIFGVHRPQKHFYFNSNLVRLKERTHHGTLRIFEYFNSNLVRLKEKPMPLLLNVPNLFQFQSGTIKG